MAMTDDSEQVQLYVYDLSNGLAAQLSPMLLGRRIEAIYHTSIVVGGAVEHFYGGGIQQTVAGQTPYGRPIQILNLGRTHIPAEVRQEFLVDISDRFSPDKYSLLHNNCNNFSDEFAQFLVGSGIPAHITSLPADVLATPFGQSIAPLLSGMEAQLSSPAQQQHAVTRANPHPSTLQRSGPAAAATADPLAAVRVGTAAAAAPAVGQPAAASAAALQTPAPAVPPTAPATPVKPAAAAAAAAEARAHGSSSSLEAGSGSPRVADAVSQALHPAAPPDAAVGPPGGASAAAAAQVAAQPAAPANNAQVAFQAALLREFTRIRDSGVSANEAAVLALQALHETRPKLAARA